MNYNQTTRDELYGKFVDSHQPGKLFNLLHGFDSKAVFKIFTTVPPRWSKEERDTFDKISTYINASKQSPAKFFKVHYGKVVEFCAGSKKEAEILYPYFDKMNQFSYSKGWARRTVRTAVYINPVTNVQAILFAAYHLQFYSCSLGKYLLNDMSEELVDFKQNFRINLNGLEDIIAAHLDAGDIEVKNAITKIITSDNNVAFITNPIIRGIFKSNDKELHKLLGQFLVAARLQEGVRQAVCENMDCGTIEAFRTLFEVIETNDLLRYSAVRRAVATWIGVLDPEHLQRSSNKTFRLMHEVVKNQKSAYELVESNDAMSILVGLWGLGFYEVQDAIKVMETIAETGSVQQKRVAAFYNQCLDDRTTQQKYANKLMESDGLDIELAAGIFETYMPDCQKEATLAAGKRIGEKAEIRPVNLSLWFEDEKTARKHLDILNHLLGQMKHRKYQFSPYVFPWLFTNITYANVLIRMCAIANGLGMEEWMDQLAERIPDLDGADNSRVSAVRLLLANPNTPKRREILIQTLGDKETYTRKEAFEIAEKMQFTTEEYDKMCELLRFKAADLRLSIISLLKKQDSQGLERSLNILLKHKREEMRLAGLDILRGLMQDTDANGNLRTEISSAIDLGKKLALAIAKPTEREQIVIHEILGNGESNFDSEESLEHEDVLYEDSDIIPVPSLTCNKSAYPLFSISKKELADLYARLDDIIYEYRNTEIKTAFGEKVLLGNQNYLPVLKYVGTPEERIPLLDLWRQFYEQDVKKPEYLMAMYLAVKPYAVTVGYGIGAASDPKYDRYIKSLVTELFGEAVIKFDVSAYRFGKCSRRIGAVAIAGADLFSDILKHLVELYCDTDYQNELGKRVAEYLCCHVPSDKRMIKADRGIGWTGKEAYLTPLNSSIIHIALTSLSEKWLSSESFNERFDVLLALEDCFMKTPQGAEAWEVRSRDNLMLKSLDFALAAYYGRISEAQMYRKIFDSKQLRSNLQNLFNIYRVEKYPAFKQHIKKYGLEDEKLDQYVRAVANKVADAIVKVECKRGDTLTPYSNAVTAIEFFYGMDHLIKLLQALGKDKFERFGSFGYNSNGSRKVNLCHLITVCHPLPKDTVDDFKKALEKTSIGEKRLIEVAMYAPQWMELIEEYLGFTGLKSGAYYFMAHMNDQYNRDQRKFAAIARFTPLEKEELFNGAFDIAWFEDAYRTLGEKRFQMLYDAAKYTSDGSRHTRARKYADATLGKVTVPELETEITAKRNKDLLMSYPLIPVKDKGDLLHRYEYIQKFRKESLQFGSQRRSSEGLACDMAMRNLATRAGFKDVTRLTLVMEMALADSLKHYFEWNPLDAGNDNIQARIQVSAAGKPDVVVRKEGKILASIPAAFKKHAYILELKESNKKFREQYSRTVKMFELSMEERELYTMGEICGLLYNPVVRPIVENLVFVSHASGVCGMVSENAGLGLVDVENVFKEMSASEEVRVAHPFDLYQSGNWAKWQKIFFRKQQEEGAKQPFRQVFRELYVKLEEELQQKYSRLFAGHQIQPTKTVSILKGRRWIADHESGLEKIFYKDNIVITMYALADWFSPSDIEPPTLEYVAFSDRKTFKALSIEEVPDIVYSEAMRDVDLAVSVAHAGSVDPEASHSTIEMRRVIMECNIDLFGLKNVTVEGTHAFIKGSIGEYTVHLGSGVVHMVGVHQLNVLPVHSQHRGKFFLPFLDDDPKTAEIVSKVLLFAQDKKIKDPYLLEQMR